MTWTLLVVVTFLLSWCHVQVLEDTLVLLNFDLRTNQILNLNVIHTLIDPDVAWYAGKSEERYNEDCKAYSTRVSGQPDQLDKAPRAGLIYELFPSCWCLGV
jgi:hypothetical protein